MKSFADNRQLSRARLALRVSASALGCAMLIAGSSAFAQEAEQEASEEIVVSGYRAALETALEVKKDSPVIAEAFSAEDVGKLPDVSIAETLGRLPGLATQRLDGRSQSLSIRGLGPDFSNTLLNGREQVSSSDNRGVEYDQYPSELINQGIVYKTPFAGLTGQGLAGTVNMKTIRPLDRNDRLISVGVRGELNDGGSLNPDMPGKGFRVTGTYVDQFADDKFGVALGAAYQSSPSQIKAFNAWGYPTTGAGNLVIGGMKPYVKSTDLDRLAAFGTLEFEPTDELNTSVDVFYSDYSEVQRLRGLEIPLFWSGAQLNSLQTVDNGFVTAGTYTNVNPVVRNDYKSKDTKVFAGGWNLNWENDSFKVDMDLSYSRSNRKVIDLESYSGLSYGAGAPNDVFQFARRDDGRYWMTTRTNYADTSLIRLTDPQGWGGGNNVVQAGFINAPDTLDKLKQARLAVTKKFDNDFLSGIEIGANYSDRSKTRAIEQSFLTLSGSGTSLSGGAVRTATIPASALVGSSTGLHFLGMGDQVTYDPLKLLASGVYTPLGVALSSFNVPQNWTVGEKVWTAWVRADIKALDGKLTGNVGVQMVHTDQTSIGSRIQAGTAGSAGVTTATFIPVVDGDKYTDWLPSLNLNYKLGENTQLRLGVARTLARARMDQLNASLSPSFNVTRLTNTDPVLSAFSASGGNAKLRPYVSDGADISIEHYFGRKGYVSAAVFYKKLKDYVNPNDAFLTDFSYLIPSTLTAAQAAILGTPLGLTSGPTNNAKGKMKGAEATIQLPFDLLSPAAEGFGVNISGSYTDSSVGPLNSTARYTVPGLSKWVLNSTIYFEKSGIEARLSHRYRSSFLAEVTGISSTRNYRTAHAESILDAQLGYRFSAGALEGLSLSVQALNITNEPFITYQNNDPRQVIDYESYGRTFLLGATYKF